MMRATKAATAALLLGATAALAANPPNALDTPPSSVTPPPVDMLQTAPTQQSPQPRELSGNPLWAIPLSSLSATRERPLFTPSRRPPAAAIAGPPRVDPVAATPPTEPERPRLMLVGAIVGDQGGIAIFVDQTTNDICAPARAIRAGCCARSEAARPCSRRTARLSRSRCRFPAPRPARPQGPPALPCRPVKSRNCDPARSSYIAVTPLPVRAAPVRPRAHLP